MIANIDSLGNQREPFPSSQQQLHNDIKENSLPSKELKCTEVSQLLKATPIVND